MRPLTVERARLLLNSEYTVKYILPALLKRHQGLSDVIVGYLLTDDTARKELEDHAVKMLHNFKLK